MHEYYAGIMGMSALCCPVLSGCLAGEPGGPQQHPWEVGAAFTTGFITYSQALLPPDANETDVSRPAQPALAPAEPGSAGFGGAGASGSIMQPLGGTTMRRSTLMQTPNQVGPAAQQQQPLQQTLRQHQQGMDRLRLSRRFMPYPQPYPLGPALLEAQMWLLGKLLSIVNPPTLLQVRHWSDVNMASFSTALLRECRSYGNPMSNTAYTSVV
jgi:hypothetical protein